ncbi:uncharacterized protein BDR25DRAFT_69783 [Lindgomyces ingoldianus]|uniref:Uncharacterized protein n=1 Tax=Lindgomyces ingoldianus TaxID=673940 RepID=A0ACB6QM79_9PLEO|nr:uncharacterized protein BDR25DRAFT_69783 [Lindgomyces ingoldianus]KAF2467227.1 hypothetical protein BDR25DRAFT_69783 [Lindgomyces ingoldianus]
MPPNTRSRSRIFGFFSLPKEIRLMIYEHLPESIIHQFVSENCIIEVSDKVCPPAILRTCRLIHAEAKGLIFNLLHHNGARICITFTGLDIDNLFLLCDKLQPSRPKERKHFQQGRNLPPLHSSNAPFDFQLFELRSFMRTPKDHEVHVNWFPCNRANLSERRYLVRFIKDLGKLYCVLWNYAYTASVWDTEAEAFIPLLDFLQQPIVGCSREFQAHLRADGFVTWKDIFMRPRGRSATSTWLRLM